MSKQENLAAMDRRMGAYIAMLKEAYGVDDAGLAEMIGVTPHRFKCNTRDGVDHMGADIFYMLADLTGISLAWLLAEDGTA